MIMNNQINTKITINYWLKSSEQSYDTAQFLFSGKKYSDCLFFCHLMLEKILKGLVVKADKTHAPYIHDLDSLAIKTKLDLSEKQILDLKIISTFNISSRYDDVKLNFHKKCTKKYTEKYFNISKELYLWLKKQYLKK